MGEMGLQPEILEVLRDVATDPRSKLLRSDGRPRRSPRDLFDTDPHDAVRRVFLGRAERHLLQVHREEVAELLLWACALLSLSTEESFVLWKRGTQVPFPSRDGDALFVRAQKLLSRFSGDAVETEAIELAVRCIGDRGSGASIGDLARASLALAPSSKARAYLGIHLVAEEDGRARKFLSSELCHHHDVASQRTLLESAGTVAFRLGRFSEAASLYRRSVEVDADSANAALGWFANSFWAAESLDRPLKCLEGLIDVGSPLLQEWRQRLRLEDKLGRVPKDGRRAVALSPVARLVVKCG